MPWWNIDILFYRWCMTFWIILLIYHRRVMVTDCIFNLLFMKFFILLTWGFVGCQCRSVNCVTTARWQYIPSMYERIWQCIWCVKSSCVSWPDMLCSFVSLFCILRFNINIVTWSSFTENLCFTQVLCKLGELHGHFSALNLHDHYLNACRVRKNCHKLSPQQCSEQEMNFQQAIFRKNLYIFPTRKTYCQGFFQGHCGVPIQVKNCCYEVSCVHRKYIFLLETKMNCRAKRLNWSEKLTLFAMCLREEYRKNIWKLFLHSFSTFFIQRRRTGEF